MRFKLRLLSLVLIAAFIFSFTGCKTTTAAETTRAAETTAAAETTQSATTTPETTTDPSAVLSDYNIGGTGPAGGLIFYVNPNYQADGWRYLEAAPGDENDLFVWFCGSVEDIGFLTNVTKTNIGAGKANTQKIVDRKKMIGDSYFDSPYAAKKCDDLTLNGYSDWFLPSKDELNLMYENLHLKGIGGFASGGYPIYWNSSEYWNGLAGYQFFKAWGGVSSGYQDGCREDAIHVRAVRAF
jgi:hypothetical protein